MQSSRKVRADASRQSSRMKSREMENSCYRLSRVPQKFAPAKAPKSDTTESYAVSFFNNNPDIPLDKRSPAEKLEGIDMRLGGDLEDNERFNLLVQKKSLCFLAFGENSPESLHALYELGEFYNQQNRPESALRHLAKAEQISRSVELTDDEALGLAIELADAHLASKANTKQENTKQLNAAEASLNPFLDVETDDKMLCYKRDLLAARIKGRKGKFADAMRCYERAVASLSDANDGETNASTAALYAEMAECAEAAKDTKTAGRMYRKAYNTFLDLDMVESAKMIEGKLTTDPETESEVVMEEEEDQKAPLMMDEEDIDE